MKRRKQEKPIFAFLLIIASSLLAISFVWILTENDLPKENVKADANVLNRLKEADTKDVAAIVASIENVRDKRAEEKRIKEEAEERERRINSYFEGSHLVAHEVRYDLTDTDIPYIRKLFSHCLVIGNSRAKNAVDCGILSTNEVQYLSGQSVEQITDFALSRAALYPKKTLFILGLNDVAYYDCDAERFYQDYKNLVLRYKEINPNGQVYLQESLPIPPEALYTFYRASHHLGEFNVKIKQVAEDTGSIFVSASDYADFRYINSEDHAHYGKEFYFLWAQTIATQMGLWEDVAGIR